MGEVSIKIRKEITLDIPSLPEFISAYGEEDIPVTDLTQTQAKALARAWSAAFVEKCATPMRGIDG